MTCQEIEKILPGYLDQGLSAEGQHQVAEHLKTCPACRQVLAELNRSVNLAQGLNDVEPPAWLKDKIMEQVRAEAKAGRRPSLFRRLFFPLHIKIPLEALAMVGVAIFVFSLYRATAPELIIPGAPRVTLQESEPAPMLDRIPSENSVQLEQRPPQPAAKTPAAAKQSAPRTLMEPALQPPQGGQRPPAFQDTNQLRERVPAPAPAAAVPAESKARDVSSSKEEEQASPDKFSKAQAPSLGLTARKTAPPGAENAVAPPALTLAVADIRQTIIALDKIVEDLKGRSMVMEQSDTVAMLRVTIKPDQFPTLMDRMAGLGEVNRIQPTPKAGTDMLIVRLEQRNP